MIAVIHSRWLFATALLAGAWCGAQDNLTRKFVLDLSGSPNQGVTVGGFKNLAFRLDGQKPARKLAIALGEQKTPEVVATFDYADCSKGQEALLAEPLRHLAPGDAAWVESVDVVLAPLDRRGPKWTGGVCYGFREPGGRWQWNLQTTALTVDPVTNRATARVLIRRGPIDAIKLVFDYKVPPHAVSSVTVTTRPMSSQADPPFTRPRQ